MVLAWLFEQLKLTKFAKKFVPVSKTIFNYPNIDVVASFLVIHSKLLSYYNLRMFWLTEIQFKIMKVKICRMKHSNTNVVNTFVQTIEVVRNVRCFKEIGTLPSF